MKTGNIIGIFLFLLGGGAIFGAEYLALQIGSGKAKVEKAQNQVDTGDALFSLNPLTQQIGQQMTGSAQKKIDQANQQIVEYELLAQQIRYTGIGLWIVSAGLLLWCNRR